MKNIKNKEPEPAIDAMKEVIKITIKMKNIQLLQSSLGLLSDLYIFNRDFQNGLYCQNLLRTMAEMTENQNLKIQALMELSETCKLMNLFQYSKIFLKKALQYIWLLDDTEQEILIYDKLGMIYFLQGKVEKAREFHERAMNSLVEIDSSAARKHALDMGQKHLRNVQYKTQGISQMLLAKLGMIGENSDDFEDLSEEKKLNLSIKSLKLQTQLDVQQQLGQITSEPEFDVEINSPINPKQCQTKNGIIQDEYLQNYQPEIVKLHKLMKKNAFDINKHFKPQQSKKNMVKLEKSQMKIDLDKKIAMIEQEQKKEETSRDRYIKQIQKFHSFFNGDQMDRCLVNHLSPNRNASGFGYHNRSVGNRAKSLFEIFMLNLLK